jgi:hypothetical protein
VVQPVTAQGPAARADVRRPLTVSAAVDQWAECQLAMDGLKVLQKEAADVILRNALRTGKRSYKDRVAVVRSGGSLVLDQEAVRAYLGAKLEQFQKRTKLGWTLKLLQ